MLACAAYTEARPEAPAISRSGTRRRLRHCCLQLGLLLIALAGVPTADAGTAPPLFVTTTTDKNDGICNADCSLREAISSANVNAGPDTIVVPSGNYILNNVFGALPVIQDLVIDATAGEVLIIGSALPRIVQLERGASAEIRGGRLLGRVVDFIGTGSGGALQIEDGTVRVIGQTVTGDLTYREGAGGIEIDIENAALAFGLNEGLPTEVGIRLADASGAALEQGASTAGEIQGTSQLEGTPALLNGIMAYRYNDTGAAIDSTVVTPSGATQIVFPTTEFVREISGPDLAIGLPDAPPLTAAAITFQYTDLDGTTAIAATVSSGAIVFAGGALAGTDAAGNGLLQENGQLTLALPLAVALPAGIAFDSGATLLEINTSSAAVDVEYEVGSTPVSLFVDEGPLTRITAPAGLLGPAGVPAIAGTFIFEEIVLDPASAVAITVGNGQFDLADGTVTVEDLAGAGLILETGQLGLEAQGPLAATIPGVDLIAGDALVQMNSGVAGFNATAVIDGNPVNLVLPGGAYARILAPLATLGLSGGPAVNGTLTLEEIALAGGPGVAIGIDDGALTMASGNVAVSAVAGAALVRNSGAFGLSATGEAALTPAALALTPDGAGTIIMNSGDTLFSETVIVGGQPVPVELPPGPYTALLLAGGIGLAGGPPINGNLRFEEVTTVAGGTGAAIEIAEGMLSLGAGALTAAGLAGTALLAPSGQLALALPADTVAFAAAGVALTGQAIAELNSTDALVGESFTFNGALQELSLPPGPYTRITALAGQLAAAGFGTFNGDFVFAETQSEEQALAALTGDNVTTEPGGMPALLDEALTGTLLPDGTYAFAAADDDADADGFAASVDNCEADFNPFQTDSNGNGIGDACESVTVPASPGAGLVLLAAMLGLARHRARRAADSHGIA